MPSKSALKKVKSGDLLADVRELILVAREGIARTVNAGLVIHCWQVGHRIRTDILREKRAAYGSEIIATLSRQLSWSHFRELITIKSQEARLFYAQASATQTLGVRELRKQISTKTFERSSIANLQNTGNHPAIHNTFKDPYFLDFLGLQNTYLEKDLEAAILRELEAFILELGKGFAFVERQKRMIIDGEDFHLDLLFYHRNLKRLVAIELKLGKFEAEHKGQMELYLKRLAPIQT